MLVSVLISRTRLFLVLNTNLFTTFFFINSPSTLLAFIDFLPFMPTIRHWYDCNYYSNSKVADTARTEFEVVILFIWKQCRIIGFYLNTIKKKKNNTRQVGINDNCLVFFFYHYNRRN